MLPYFVSYHGNPHSRTHTYGWESEAAVEKAREQIANLISADPKEIIFTSGATESNNISVKGVARFYAPRKKHIVTTQIVSTYVCLASGQSNDDNIQRPFELLVLFIQNNNNNTKYLCTEFKLALCLLMFLWATNLCISDIS